VQLKTAFARLNAVAGSSQSATERAGWKYVSTIVCGLSLGPSWSLACDKCAGKGLSAELIRRAFFADLRACSSHLCKSEKHLISA
jgi:hypothetical protein